MESQGSNTYKIVSSIIIGLLLILSCYLFYEKNQNTNLISKQETKLVDSEREKAEFEKNYEASVIELNDLKGLSEKLNAKIDSQQTVMKTQHDKIIGLFKASKDKKIIQAEIIKLRNTINIFKNEITELKKENEKLASENEKLNSENSIILDQVSKERTYSDELSNINSSLIDENSNLQNQKQELSKKIDKAKVIKVSDILVEGYKLTSGGKQVSKRSAKSVDGLRVCFKTSQNDIAESGRETFYVRIISPNGETINIPSSGSGIIESNNEEGEIPYSFSKDFTYENAEAVSCSNWQPSFTFPSGNFQVHIYNKGFLAGKSTFSLK